MIGAARTVGPGPGVRSESLEDQARGVAEDAVVGDQWDAQANRGRCDPAIGVVVPLCERVSRTMAVHSQLGVDPHELWARMNDLDLGEFSIDPIKT